MESEASSPAVGAPVVRWLLLICLLILAMVVVGGITRLTGSGLSITEWKPIMGAIPPLSAAEWQEAFARYQQIPQYRLVNHDMTVDQFKWIFFWEYFHRLLGRTVVLAYLLPWAAFSRRWGIGPRLHRRLAVGLALFGLQGLMGWVMVMSGLSERTSVSHYRLAAHLSLALGTLSYLLWVVRQQRPVAQGGPAGGVGRALSALLGLTCLQIVYGALMAGLKAGYLYATFPTLNGEWLPSGGLALSPAWLNPLQNPAAVHFLHRALGYGVLASGASLGWTLRRQGAGLPAELRAPAAWAAWATLGQFLLGVLCVVSHVALPVAVLHQVGGALLLGLTLWAWLTARALRPRPQPG